MTNDKAMIWQDKKGITHGVTGAKIVRDEPIILWTKCERKDVPANKAWFKRPIDFIDCEYCKAVEQTGEMEE